MRPGAHRAISCKTPTVGRQGDNVAKITEAKLREQLSLATRMMVFAELLDYSGHLSARIPDTDRVLKFHGKTSAAISPGEEILSDPFDFNLAPLTNVAVTISFASTPGSITGHPGSRTTSSSTGRFWP